jgi:hypothetical protein
VHGLVIIETGHIDARFKHEIKWNVFHLYDMNTLLNWGKIFFIYVMCKYVQLRVYHYSTQIYHLFLGTLSGKAYFNHCL